MLVYYESNEKRIIVSTTQMSIVLTKKEMILMPKDSAPINYPLKARYKKYLKYLHFEKVQINEAVKIMTEILKAVQ